MLRIDSLNVVNESDIDWKSLSDPTWNMWSGHCLQQKWRSMKIACKLDDSVCHRGECTTFIPPVIYLTFPIDAVAHLVAIVALRGQMPKSSTATKTSAPLSPSPPSTGVP